MKRFRCLACDDAQNTPDWEDHRSESHCRACGAAGTRIVEFGCFAHDEPIRFWDIEAPTHACPECGCDSYRIVYAPSIITQGNRERFDAADAMTIAELERQKASTTSLTRETSRSDNPFAAHWASQNVVLPPGSHGVGGQLPFTTIRPRTNIVGKFDAPA